jgi:hypothetical protein
MIFTCAATRFIISNLISFKNEHKLKSIFNDHFEELESLFDGSNRLNLYNKIIIKPEINASNKTLADFIDFKLR